MFKIRKSVDAGNVRALCIKRGLYTNGTNTEYEETLNKCKDATNDDLALDIALDIWAHSSPKHMTDGEGYYFEAFLFDFFEDCVYTFVDRVDE